MLVLIAFTGTINGENKHGGRTEKQINLAFEAYKTQIFATYQEALKTKPGLGGKLTFSINVTKEGNVKGCDAKSENTDIEQIISNVCKIINEMNFGAGEQVTFSYVINFFPGP